MLNSLQEYLEKIRNLRRYPGAPYKPFLLLGVIELIEQGDIHENRMPLSYSLIDTFHRYTALTPDGSSSIHNPFFHLKMLSVFRHSAVLLPEHDQLYPSQHALDWHRENIMQHAS